LKKSPRGSEEKNSALFSLRKLEKVLAAWNAKAGVEYCKNPSPSTVDYKNERMDLP
jgi:hypothetical protein